MNGNDHVRFGFRLPAELHERVRALAELHVRSLNAELVWLVQNAVEAEERALEERP